MKCILVIMLLIGRSRCENDVLEYSTPIHCEMFDKAECERNPDRCEIVQSKCDPDLTHCFVLWQTNNSTGQHEIVMKGCFTQSRSCKESECVDRAFELRKNNTNFCCCTGDLCNSDHRWDPVTIKPATDDINTTEPNYHHHFVYVSIGSVVTTITILVLIVIVWHIRNRKRNADSNEDMDMEPEITDSNSCLAVRPIELVELKARGRFGAVWHARLKDDHVAVKIFPGQEKESWVSEQDIYMLPRMMHPNILEFIGAEKHTEGMATEYWLITAYQHQGSLCDYLNSNTVTWTELLKIAESMATGLTHLHEEIASNGKDDVKPAIAHRDFKSKNVLLKQDLTACIADFGLAHVFTPGTACGDTHGQVGTRRYMAPEVLEGAINFTQDAFLRIDVYACGLVLWELVSRCTAQANEIPPYSLPFTLELGSHPSLEEMQENIAVKKIRPKIEETWREHNGLGSICDTIEECWDHDAEARLSASCVMERIAKHRKNPMVQLHIESNAVSA